MCLMAHLATLGGLSTRLMAMLRFCNTRSMPYNTRSDLRREPPSDYVRFCFADPAHANAFIAEFGGERITIESHKPSSLC
jgi:hypothetical protein